MSAFSKIFGDPNEKVIKKIQPLVDQVARCESKFSGLSNDELKAQTALFRERLHTGKETLDDLLPEAFAACREAAKRVLNQRHFDVQVIGSIVLHRGQIAEMRTGEGKTLMATLAVYLNALAGKGVHVITVNDYLAQRDSVWMGQVYHALGMTVGCVQHETAYVYDPSFKVEKIPEEQREGIELEQDALGSFKVAHDFLKPCTRKEAYAVDITYGTNNEFGFDYLRDNLVNDINQEVQRGRFFAIIDEVDSILIDEARTPLIISGAAEESADTYYTFAKIIAQLQEETDYNIDEKMRAATLTDEGIGKVEKALGMENLYAPENLRLVNHLEQSLKAQALFKRDKDYVVRSGEVLIVDEFTGRLMEGRRYSEGLHQAIEAKEGVPIQRETRTYATVTFQNYFRTYEKLAGMTGTAATEAEEFSKIYKLEVVSIPTNRAAARKDLSDRVYKTEAAKYQAVVEHIKECNEKGQPVLVGTISIEKNEYLSKLLTAAGVQHEVLNAKNHEREGEIIAQAGRLKAVTIATNMAGRGVDILLGGNPVDAEEVVRVRETGGLCVIGTERHESRRIDNQLRGRAGRQGDPGMSQFYVSMEDDLMRIFGSDRMKGMMDRLGLPDDVPIENKMVSRSLEEAQKKVEGHNFDIRKHLVEYDDIINKHREVIYKKRRDVLTAYELDTAQKPSDVQEAYESQLKRLMLEMVEEEIERVVMFHTKSDNEGEWDLKEIYEVVNTIFPLPESDRKDLVLLRTEGGSKFESIQAKTMIIEYCMQQAVAAYAVFENRLISKAKELGAGNDAWNTIRHIERDLMVRAIDTLWVEHLEAIDRLRAGIGLRGYGQRDPLVEYKRESFRLFSELLAFIHQQVVYTIFKIGYSLHVEKHEDAPLDVPENAELLAPAKEGDEGVVSQPLEQ